MPADSLAELWRAATGREPGKVTFVGDEHVLPGPYRVGHAAAVCVAAASLAAADLCHDRGGTPDPVTVHIGHAAAAFRSERHVRVVGQEPGALWASLSGDYRAADGWVRLHANYPHHEAAILAALGIPPADDVAARVRAAVATRPAIEVEEAVLAAGGAAAAMRDRASWLTDGPGAAIRAEQLVAIERIAAAPPRVLPPLVGRAPEEGVADEGALAEGPVARGGVSVGTESSVVGGGETQRTVAEGVVVGAETGSPVVSGGEVASAVAEGAVAGSAVVRSGAEGPVVEGGGAGSAVAEGGVAAGAGTESPVVEPGEAVSAVTEGAVAGRAAVGSGAESPVVGGGEAEGAATEDAMADRAAVEGSVAPTGPGAESLVPEGGVGEGPVARGGVSVGTESPVVGGR